MAAEYYLEIVTRMGGKIKGESLSNLCKDQIQVRNFVIGMESPDSRTDGISRAAGRVQLETAEFEFIASAATAPLVSTICQNDQIKNATLSCCKAGHNGKTGIYMQWRFNDARLISYHQTGDGDEPREKIRIAYAGIEICYKQQKGDGSLGTNPLQAAYDAGENAMAKASLECK